MLDKTILIGAGFSSAVLSRLIKYKNLTIFDKARGPGGRSSTRRVDKIGVFDHGLQFISPENVEFTKFLDSNLQGHIKKWEGDFIDFDNGQKLIDKKNTKYIGINGNSDFVKNLISVQSFYEKELISINRSDNLWTLEFKDKSIEKCSSLILTIPFEQCQKIIKPLNIPLKFNGNMEPNLTTMIALNKNLSLLTSGFKFTKNSILGWAANETSKLRPNNNDQLELWTLQSSTSFAKKKHKNYKIEKKEIMNLMISEFFRVFNITDIGVVHGDIHGWLYAFKKENFLQNFYWNKEMKLGICGDWMCGPKAEDAWNSASKLADQINNS